MSNYSETNHSKPHATALCLSKSHLDLFFFSPPYQRWPLFVRSLQLAHMHASPLELAGLARECTEAKHTSWDHPCLQQNLNLTAHTHNPIKPSHTVSILTTPLLLSCTDKGKQCDYTAFQAGEFQSLNGVTVSWPNCCSYVGTMTVTAEGLKVDCKICFFFF